MSDGEGSLTPGSHEASTLDMATAYTALAARGLRCHPRPVLSVTAGGRPVSYGAPEPYRQVIRPEVADAVFSVLQGMINQGTAARNDPIGRPVAGKTGTAENHSDAWFVGHVPQVAAAVTVADPRGMTKYLLQVSPYTPKACRSRGGTRAGRSSGETCRPRSGRERCANILKGGHSGRPSAASGQHAAGHVEGWRSGRRRPGPAGRARDAAGAGLSAHVSVVGDRGRRGTVVRTDPPPGAQVELGSSVTLFVAGSGRGTQPLPARALSRRGTTGAVPFPLPTGPPILVAAGGTGR